MLSTGPERRQPRWEPFDYWHEKVALTKYAHDLAAEGWEVGLSVSPARLDDAKPLGGAKQHVLDDDFRREFDSRPAPGESAFRYNFYKDISGFIDLVARRDGTLIVVEGKGRSASSRRGAIAQIVGTLTLERRPDRSDIRYQVVLPGAAGGASQEEVLEAGRWDRALRNYGGLGWIEILRIDRVDGTIRQGHWPDAQGGAA